MDKLRMKNLCENDLFYLCQEILGYKNLSDNTHVEVCEFLESPAQKKILLLPRGTFKTSIGTVGRAVQEICKNPNIRILIWSETFGQAKKFLSEIKQHLSENQALKDIYGTFYKDPGWKEEEITVRQRTKVLKEPTVSAGGVDVTKVGFHYDLIIIDDPHSQMNITTKDQIDKVKNSYKLLLPMLEPTGELCFNGTRWHFYDLASMLLENDTFVKMVRTAETRLPDGTVKLFFPERLTKDYLNQQKLDMGSYLFSCQYQNNPVDDENADFKKKWFKYFKIDEIKRKLLNIYITIDTAVSQRETADFIGVTINGVDRDNNWYFLKVLKLKIGPADFIKLLFDWNNQYHPIKIGIEAEKYTLVIKPFLDEEMKRRNEYLPIVELTHKVANKEMRIRGLTPRYERGVVYHNADDPGVVDLEDEALRFPKGQHDDVLDSASMQLDLAKPPMAAEQVDYSPKRLGHKPHKYYPELNI